MIVVNCVILLLIYLFHKCFFTFVNCCLFLNLYVNCAVCADVNMRVGAEFQAVIPDFIPSNSTLWLCSVASMRVQGWGMKRRRGCGLDPEIDRVDRLMLESSRVESMSKSRIDRSSRPTIAPSRSFSSTRSISGSSPGEESRKKFFLFCDLEVACFGEFWSAKFKVFLYKSSNMHTKSALCWANGGWLILICYIRNNIGIFPLMSARRQQKYWEVSWASPTGLTPVAMFDLWNSVKLAVLTSASVKCSIQNLMSHKLHLLI